MKPTSQASRFARSQRMAIVNGILVIVVVIVVLQLWLFTATMNAYLGGDYAIVIPAALVSLGCLLLIGGLIWYLYRLED
jgi:protein-S-isoprenylcysteine O-methyltransferase Ste14